MPVIKIPAWLASRPIDSDDTEELILLSHGRASFSYKDITVEALERFYKQQPRFSFYKLIRVLGFYGVIFSGKLAGYSGPQDEYPDVLYIEFPLRAERIVQYVKDQKIVLPFSSCGIQTMKQLHGVPVYSFSALTGIPFSGDQITSLLPASIIQAHDNLFIPTQTIPAKYRIPPGTEVQNPTAADFQARPYISQDDSDPRLSKPIETLCLSFRSLKRLKAEGIYHIGELVARNEDELLAIPHLGWKSCREIKTRLLGIGLQLRMHFGKQLKTQTDQNDIDCCETGIDTLNLSVRSGNCLETANIHTISDLLRMTDEDLLSVPHLGRKSLREIKKELSCKYPEQIEAKKRSLASKLEETNKIDLSSAEVLASLNIKVGDLVLSVRTWGGLEKKEIDYIWQLVQLTEKELLEIRNLGRKSIKELRDILTSLGFWFGMEFTPEQIRKICTYKPTTDRGTLDESLKEVLLKLNKPHLDFLNDVENLVVSNRIFKEGKKKSLEAIAQKISLSRERIRQIEKSALIKIRQHHKSELLGIVSSLKQQVEDLGGLAKLEGLDLGRMNISAKEQAIVSSLVELMDNDIFIDWDYGLVSTRGKEFIVQICDEIRESILQHAPDKFFTSHDLNAASSKVLQHHNLFLNQEHNNLIKKFYRSQKISIVDNQLCFGRATKQDKLILAFKKFFPRGLDIYKKRNILIQSLQEFDRELFHQNTPRSILARLTDHPDVFLWGRGFFIHKDNVTYEKTIVKKVAAWIEARFTIGHSRFQIDIPFNRFRKELLEGGVPTPYALYTLLRLENRKRIGQRKYPTIVDLEADIDLQEGILEELENYFFEAGKAVPYSQLKKEFLLKRGWKVYSLQQNISSHSDVIYPWQDNTYIHLDFMAVDYARLNELLDALRDKLHMIQGAYSLKGAKKEMNVLWEQVCPGASVRTMVKLIRSVDPEDLQTERYFIQLADRSSESVSTVAELEEFFLEKGVELTKYELQEEFCNQRGWSDMQLYAAIRRASLFRSGKSTFLHPSTIGWNESLSQQVHLVMETHLRERNNDQYPYMQLEVLIYQYALPELPHDIQWTRHLLKSVGEEFGDFVFFDDAYIFADNDFGIEDLDDMIGFLIGYHFQLGIAKKAKVEQMLWREGILESGRAIPASQFFAESSICYLPESDEVGLSSIGFERYGRPIQPARHTN